jgi:hypothetical protein
MTALAGAGPSMVVKEIGELPNTFVPWRARHAALFQVFACRGCSGIMSDLKCATQNTKHQMQSTPDWNSSEPCCADDAVRQGRAL